MFSGNGSVTENLMPVLVSINCRQACGSGSLRAESLCSHLVRLRLADILCLLVSSSIVSASEPEIISGLHFPSDLPSDSTFLPLSAVDEFLESICVDESLPCMYVGAPCMYSYHRDRRRH